MLVISVAKQTQVIRKRKKTQHCWNFNRGQVCKYGHKCRFVERCSFCDSGAHGIVNCPTADKKDKEAALAMGKWWSCWTQYLNVNFTKTLNVIILITATAAVLWSENFNLHEIITSVNAEKCTQLLRKTGYDERKTTFLSNLKIRIGSKLELWNKVMKEVAAKRYAGPFEEVPFKHFIQSPIGLSLKTREKTRLIFHLSYPRDGKATSVNACIPKEVCSVKYPDFQEAVQLCRQVQEGTKSNLFGQVRFVNGF